MVCLAVGDDVEAATLQLLIKHLTLCFLKKRDARGNPGYSSYPALFHPWHFPCFPGDHHVIDPDKENGRLGRTLDGLAL